jgi:hypothetical protein
MQLPAGMTLSRPAQVPAPGWAELGTWFEAPTPHGPLRLYASDALGAARHAAEAAVLLHRCEEWLGGLDAWHGAPLEWRFTEGPACGATATAPQQVRIHWRDGGHQLMGPWPWLRSLPAPAAGFAERLNWPALELVLVAARLQLGDEDLQALEPGGAVLLPESMQPGWTGWLRGAADAASAGPGVPVRFTTPAEPMLVAGTCAAAAPPPVHLGATACEVRLAVTQGLGADRLAGWRDEPLPGLVAPDLGASLWRCATARERARCLAHGRLMPWGDGWALALQGMSEAEPVRSGLSHIPAAFAPLAR